MENFNFKKINKKPDAEQLKINFDDESIVLEDEDKKDETQEKESNNISTEYDFEALEELIKNGDLEEVDPKNTEDDSYINLKDLDMKDDLSWDLYGRYNDIKNRKKENQKNIKKGITNEDRIRRNFNRDNLR